MTIKVLHYLRNLGLGGTEKTCQLFFEHASRDEFQVALVHESTGDKKRLYEFQQGATVVRAPIFEINSYEDPKRPNGRALQNVIDIFKPDILHVYRSGYSEYPDPGLDVQVPHFVETNVFGFVDRNPRIDKTLFMSKWLMDHMLKGLQHPRFDFVNNPVEMPVTGQALPWRAEADAAKAIILGRVGRPDNGIYNAIHVEAARLLRLQGLDVRFLVVAPPENMVRDLLKAEIPHKVIPPTTDPLLLSMAYNTMHIYAHARADGETFGVNIAEAMIHGLPVVTHIAVPSFAGMGVFQSQTELVEDSRTGFIVSNDPVLYSEALKLLIENETLRLRFGQAGLVKAVEQYYVPECMEKLERIYKEIVHEDQSSSSR
jgi:glycosyltransferase involved in cell wall biosynthesis